MLDTDTKRRIDTARDILVGKVPDPKSQVEQITIALIYKFMDDMDSEAVELGGKRKFFTGEYAEHRWSRLMEKGGNEKLLSYSEGIAKMTQNTALPELFRNIFKNAYLPYRDPETLNAFLKIIDQFSYDHSERLGDAFEYLLNVLGSQGDAGQFRTPRHIIDFMVEILDPKKTETVLDPACGTAGFLISAYKHIRRMNVDGKGRSTLTPDDKGRLAKNFKGYDISPDMVRLSLVNLYLHGFTDPHVYEYDTLTEDSRWNEFADVILANPPFMSPKGGIKPHKRFSIQAKRSEVLFVDYMAEHLTPTGRAGIIVPEGIIFQSQTAYVELRKMLVETCLVAVVSLPAGCFNPYSGVKTSILILDKALAKRSDSIGFFKVENDGFGLGAQRRAIEKNDLPQVKAELTAYLDAVRTGSATEGVLAAGSTGQIVGKDKIAADGEYNLGGERYRDAGATPSEFPHVALKEVCEINPDTVNPADLYPQSYFNYIDISCVENESGNFLGPNKMTTIEAPSRARRAVKQGDILMSTVRPNLKAFALLTDVPDRAVASTGFAVLRTNPERLLPGFLINVLRNDRSVNQMIGMAGKGAYPSINQTDVASLQIPLPPLEVQKEIVAEIEGYQKVINGARAVLDHYRPHIPIHPDWPMVLLSEVVKLSSGTFLPSSMMKDGPCPVYGGNGINGTHDEYLFESPTVVIGRVGAYCGSVHLTKPKAWVTDNALYVKELLVPMNLAFLEQALRSLNLNSFAKVGGQPSISQSTILERKIALPPLDIQQALMAEIEAEQALVAANRELIKRFERKIQATLARIWGEEPTTSATAPADS